jgi:putative membrane protein
MRKVAGGMKKWNALLRSCYIVAIPQIVGSHPTAEGGSTAFHLRPTREKTMRLLLQWILSAIALLLVSKIVPGFQVHGLWPALIAALVIGLLNATVGFLLKIITFPLSILTLGLFLLVINGIMILVASNIVPGFRVYGFGPAFWGAVVLALLGMVIRAIVKDA